MKSNQMTLQDAIQNRRSVRGFKPDPVPDDIIQEILQLAQLSPSNCNVQPWRVLLATGDACNQLRDKMYSAITQGKPVQPDFSHSLKFEGTFRQRQVDCAKALYGAMGIERDDKVGRMKATARNYEFFDAPNILFIGMDKSFGVSIAVDVGMYAQSLMLLMTAYGLSSCAQASVSYYPEIVREFFDEPENTGILFGISFGYEDVSVDANEARTSRAPLNETVVWKKS